jgi:tetratricopeptide (TPR) repeat protein
MGARGHQRLFSELRRRRVLPVAGAYLVIGWLVTEITGFLLQQAGAPGWAIRLMAIVFVVGFPVVVTLAWIIQRRPDGKWSLDSSQGQGRAVLVTVALGVLATAGLAWLILPNLEDASAVPGYEPLPNSLAILPLAAADATPNERVVAETLYTALLEGLNQSRELVQVRLNPDVPASDPLNLGRRVRVSALLTGRVQAIPGGSQVALELLDVALGTVRWSRSVAWNPTRVMETGAEVANGVLDAMGMEPLSQHSFAGTENREAYDALLLGFRYQRSFNVEELSDGMDAFQRAIDLDPEFIDAYLGLAQTIFVYLNVKGPSQAERAALRERQRELVETAYALDENHPDTLSLMGLLTENHELQVQIYERALELDPDNGHTYFRLAHARRSEGNPQEAERLIRRALEFTPQSANYRSDLAFMLWDLGRYDEATEELNRSIELNPGMAQNYQRLAAWNMFHYGRVDEAIINLRKAYALDPGVGHTAAGVATNYMHIGMQPEAYAWINRAIELSPTAVWVWIMAAYVHSVFGDEELAREEYERCLELGPTQAIPLRTLAEGDIRDGRWDQARERWGEAYPELVHADPPVVNPSNIQAAAFYAINLEQAGLGDQADSLLAQIEAVISELPPDSEWVEFFRSFSAQWIDPDPDWFIRELRKQIVDKRQRVELHFSHPEYDIVRDRPEFQELVRIVEEDLAMQRERLQAMERNGEMPPAPGVVLIDR